MGRGMAVERAVVTGGAGFVGSSVVEALAGRGTSARVRRPEDGCGFDPGATAGTVEHSKHVILDAGRGAPRSRRSGRTSCSSSPPARPRRVDARPAGRRPGTPGSMKVFGAAAALGGSDWEHRDRRRHRGPRSPDPDLGDGPGRPEAYGLSTADGRDRRTAGAGEPRQARAPARRAHSRGGGRGRPRVGGPADGAPGLGRVGGRARGAPVGRARGAREEVDALFDGRAPRAGRARRGAARRRTGAVTHRGGDEIRTAADLCHLAAPI